MSNRVFVSPSEEEIEEIISGYESRVDEMWSEACSHSNGLLSVSDGYTRSYEGNEGCEDTENGIFLVLTFLVDGKTLDGGYIGEDGWRYVPTGNGILAEKLVYLWG